MRFENKTLDVAVSYAILNADLLLRDGSKMIEEIKLKNDFRYDSGPGGDVVRELLKVKAPIEVYWWSPWRPTSAVGYFDGQAIHINKRKAPYFTTVDFLGLMLHEYAHYQGFHHADPGWWGQRRANYKTEQKVKHSVPYFISENVGRWI
jgi:hypothetical protein